MKHGIAINGLLRMTIAQILASWPSAAEVFIDHRMACIGCDFSRFHRLEDALEIYQLEPSPFCGKLRQAIGHSGEGLTKIEAIS